MRFVAGGCAFGLALVLTLTLGIPDETGQHSPSSARESNDCSQDFEKVVTELVAARDQALIMREDEALFTLTVEGSAVRAQDEDLLASLADSEITELHTRVDAVHLLGNWEACADSGVDYSGESKCCWGGARWGVAIAVRRLEPCWAGVEAGFVGGV